MNRVAVFVDYQNVWYRARELFCPDYAADARRRRTAGHTHPHLLGHLLTDLGASRDPNRTLTAVRVYRGQPVSGRSRPNACRIYDRQAAVWEQHPIVSLHTRPLRYHRATNPDGSEYWAGREKGVDVMLALDISIGARNDLYDTAIVASADHDILPAIEDALEVGKRVETATWGAPRTAGGPPRPRGRSIWNHYLGKAHFDRVCDETDYLIQ